MATEQGLIKRVPIGAFANVRRSGLIAITLKEGDVLRWVHPSDGNRDILLTTALGFAIRFKESRLRAMSRIAQGVIGIKRRKNDKIIGVDTIDKKNICHLVCISEGGYGKMTDLKEYRVQSRAGKGIKTMKVTKKTGNLVSAWAVYLQNLPEDKKGDVILISKQGQVIRIPLKSLPIRSRATQGVRLMKLKKGDAIAQVALV